MTMVGLIKKIWYSIVPQEHKRSASDVVLRGINSAGKDYTLTIPTVSAPKNKDGYYIQEPLALPESMSKSMGYGYETEPDLKVVEK